MNFVKMYGADGLILAEPSEEYGIWIHYYNQAVFRSMRY